MYWSSVASNFPGASVLWIVQSEEKVQFMSQEVDSEALSKAVIKLMASFDRLSSTEFLQEINIKKSNEIRLIAWFIELKILPKNPQRAATAAVECLNSYLNLIHKYITAESTDPLSLLPSDEGKVAQADLSRTIVWFHDMGRQLHIPGNALSGAEGRVARLLAFLSLESPDFSYTQGFDRFAFISYLISLHFTVQNNLAVLIAEVLAFYLTRSLIRMSDFGRILDAGKKNIEHFRDLDEIIAQEFPDIMQRLIDAGNSSLHFALRWQILMFADEHTAEGLFLIWDNLIVHYAKGDYRRYMTCLCLAHVSQVKIVPGTLVVGSIQHYKDWDVPELIRFANNFDSPSLTTEMIIGGVAFAVIVVAFGVYIFRRNVHK